MAYDGIQFGPRVDNFGNRKLYTKVVDQVLNSPTVASRYISQGKPFNGKTEDVTYDILSDTSGQWITGLETLNSSAVDTTVTGSVAQTAFTQPIVSIMLESFANVGTLGIINLDTFKYEKGAAQALQAIGSAIWGTGAAGQMLGLNAIIDDGTNVASILGLTRSTYPVLESVLTAYSSGKLTLATMGVQYDSCIASGMVNETPNMAYTTKAIWTLGEQLLSPQVRAGYRDVGYDRVGLRAKFGQRNNATLKGAIGFNSWTFREMDVIRDDFGTSGVLYMANEDYIDFKGRSEIPAEYKDVIEKVDFGTMSAYEGTGAMALELPSEFNGWFYQNPLTIPDQAGRIARFYCIGNMVPRSYRRHSKGTGITGV